ncbi:hypothetical protein C8Q73DRAFT_695629 [Cubamyces lactineus]|nr:hypothetical protein C8Q73DRAFT_695629 [Cubamyces lactineus]
MLSTNGTPRPRPPAKARKSSSLHFSSMAPPPPYAPPLSEMLLDSPIPVTTQLISALSPDGTGAHGGGPMEEWMEEKSREELSGLLLKADGIIKTRETEMGYTSALCKSLYDDNVALKTKHEALLARLPSGTGLTSPSPSTPTSPRMGSSSFVGSSSFSAVMFPTSSEDSLQPLPPAARLRHTRRISVTPTELAHLADQNAELLDKLEKLEAESTKADRDGRRKLATLEKEIQTLREELDRTQAKGAELEEQAKAAVNAVQAQRLKEEREAWRQAMKKTDLMTASDSYESEVRDFAPPPELPRSTSRKRRFLPLAESDVSADSSDVSFDQSSASFDSDPSEEEDPAVHSPFFPTSQASTHGRSGTEFAIISQLLSKIRELEETNAQIKEQQKMTEERMRAAQWDVDTIRRVYDCLDVADIDIEDPEEEPAPSRRVPSGGTIRFSSLRRTLVRDMSNLVAQDDEEEFADGILKEMQSTVRDDPTGHRGGGPGHKARKSVVGLFDPQPGADAGSEEPIPPWGEYPPSLKASPSFRPAAKPAEEADTSMWSIAATDGLAPPSPTLSTLQTPTEGPHTGRTLGSELGSEFGDDWPERGFNHHLRASSLHDLAGLNTSQSAPGSPAETHPPYPLISFPNENIQAEECVAGPSTPPRAPALQLNIEPPTPTPDRLRSPAATRQHRLSQTVRARTNRWVEGRFQQDSLRDNVLRKRQSTSTLGRRPSKKGKSRAAPGQDPGAILDETFDDAVLQVKRVRHRASLASLGFSLSAPASPPDAAAAAEEDESGDAEKSVELRRLSHGEAAAVADSVRREGIVGFVLEAWLWLQFIVVVMLFLWAMAKRGPKVVLEAERRGAHRGAGHSSG